MAMQTTNALDLFHQKLEAHKESTITANNHLDSRMSKIENSTKQIGNAMTDKLEEFALQQGKKLGSLATEQTNCFTGFTAVIADLNQMQIIEQQGINDRFESIMNVLQTIQTSQQSASKLTWSPTTDIDPLPDHKKPASTRDSSLDFDPMDVSSPLTQHHPETSLTENLHDHPPD